MRSIKTDDKNPHEFYGKGYLHRVMSGTGGRTRWENNDAFKFSGMFLRDFVEQERLANVLDVGCGRGWVVYNLREHGVEADGCEYSQESVDLSVCGSVKCDLTLENGLPFPDESYDLVSCLGVLSHFPARYAANALSELHRVSRRYLWANVLVWEEEAGDPFPPNQEHHLNVVSRVWWPPIFGDAGWRRTNAADRLIEQYQYGRNRYQFTAMWEKQ